MTRRIALFSDVHGNLHALDAVLADISDAGASEVYCLGDLVGYGPDPAGVIERIKPKDGDPRASWIEMLLGPKGQVRQLTPADGAASAIGTSDLWLGMVAHRVDYDIESVASAMIAAGLPATLAIALRNA